MPVKALRDYYGEKIALYFYLLSFYTKNLIPIAIIGIPFFALMLEIEYVLPADPNYKLEDSATLRAVLAVYSTIFIIIVVIWSSVIVGKWQRCELNFAITYG